MRILLFMVAIVFLAGCQVPESVSSTAAEIKAQLAGVKPKTQSEKIEADMVAAVKTWRREQQLAVNVEAMPPVEPPSPAIWPEPPVEPSVAALSGTQAGAPQPP